eukprot:scaffold7192_cov204-Ochromonas_danica.AAC.2
MEEKQFKSTQVDCEPNSRFLPATGTCHVTESKCEEKAEHIKSKTASSRRLLYSYYYYILHKSSGFSKELVTM